MGHFHVVYFVHVVIVVQKSRPMFHVVIAVRVQHENGPFLYHYFYIITKLKLAASATVWVISP